MRRLLAVLGPNRRVRFARVRAAVWVVLGAASFPLGWADSVVLVWIASVYANVESGVASGEAADDSDLAARLDRIEAKLDRIAASTRTAATRYADHELDGA